MNRKSLHPYPFAIIPLLFLVIFTTLPYRSFAEGKLVRGQVLDETGHGLPGAAVSAGETAIATVTDDEGKFSFEVPVTTRILVVQAVGYEKQEVLITQAPLLIRMQVQQQALGEIIVTAYGVRRNKNDLPYSAQKVSGSEITATRESNFINALQGKVAGLDIERNNNFGGSTNVVLRGIKSIDGNNQALFIVDGVPVDNSNTNTLAQQVGSIGYDYGNAAADINPDNIESVTVLKGAAATALYGSRAANGVILVTTKKAGRPGFGITVNSGFTTGSIDKSTWIKYQNEYGGGYGPYYESPDGYFLYRDILGNGTEELVVPTSEDASFGARFDRNLLVYDWKSLDPNSPYYHQKTPWVAAANDPSTFFVKPFSSNLSITASGANETGGFSVGYTRTTDKGIIENSSLIKDLVNISSSYKLTGKLTLSATANVSNINGRGRNNTGYNGSVAGSFRQWWQTNVDIKELREAYFREKGTNATWNYLDPDYLFPIYWNNPYWNIYENYENDSRLRFFGNIALNYALTEWLDILGRVGTDAYHEQQEERNAIGSVETSSYNRYNHNYSEMNYDLIGNFHKQLSSSFTLSGLLGTNIRRTHHESMRAATNGGLIIPGFYALSNSANLLSPPEETDERVGVNGVFAGATLDYKSLLIGDLTLRRDRSSTLPQSHNAYYYPSVSLGFVFSKLLPENNAFTFGKARINYAEVGNSAPAYSITDLKYPRAPFQGQPVYHIGYTKNNEELKPERTKSMEAGLELAFWRNRAGLDLTWYNTHSVDQIMAVPVSGATGYNYKYVNAGDIRNRGIELSAFITPVKTRNFSWLLNMNYARNRNQIMKLPEIDNIQLVNWGSPTLNAALGKPYGIIRGTDYVYDDNGNKVVDETGHYLISETSDHIIGNTNPDWTGGISNTLKYKTVALSFLISIRKGGQVFSIDRWFGLSEGLPAKTVGNNDLGNPMRNDPDDPDHPGGIILDGVKEDGTKNDIRIPVEYGTFGDIYNPDKAFVYDASYVKLRELSLSYSLPVKWMQKIQYVKNIEVSFVARNLWIIYKNIPDADPEDGFSSGKYQGFQSGSFPTARTYGFNLKFNF